MLSALPACSPRIIPEKSHPRLEAGQAPRHRSLQAREVFSGVPGPALHGHSLQIDDIYNKFAPIASNKYMFGVKVAVKDSRAVHPREGTGEASREFSDQRGAFFTRQGPKPGQALVERNGSVHFLGYEIALERPGPASPFAHGGKRGGADAEPGELSGKLPFAAALRDRPTSLEKRFKKMLKLCPAEAFQEKPAHGGRFSRLDDYDVPVAVAGDGSLIGCFPDGGETREVRAGEKLLVFRGCLLALCYEQSQERGRAGLPDVRDRQRLIACTVRLWLSRIQKLPSTPASAGRGRRCRPSKRYGAIAWKRPVGYQRRAAGQGRALTSRRRRHILRAEKSLRKARAADSPAPLERYIR